MNRPPLTQFGVYRKTESGMGYGALVFTLWACGVREVAPGIFEIDIQEEADGRPVLDIGNGHRLVELSREFTGAR